MPTMPNVVGLEYPAALQSMVAAGVRVLPFGYFQVDPVVLAWIRSTVKPGFVTAQSPASGATVVANSAALFTVSQLPVSVAYGE